MTRLRITLAATAGLIAIGATLAPTADAVEPKDVAVQASTWLCISNDALRVGVCLSNPLRK